MEVELGKVRDFGQGAEIERPIQLLIDVFNHSMHSALVLRAAISRSHVAPCILIPSRPPELIFESDIVRRVLGKPLMPEGFDLVR